MSLCAFMMFSAAYVNFRLSFWGAILLPIFFHNYINLTILVDSVINTIHYIELFIIILHHFHEESFSIFLHVIIYFFLETSFLSVSRSSYKFLFRILEPHSIPPNIAPLNPQLKTSCPEIMTTFDYLQCCTPDIQNSGLPWQII